MPVILSPEPVLSEAEGRSDWPESIFQKDDPRIYPNSETLFCQTNHRPPFLALGVGALLAAPLLAAPLLAEARSTMAIIGAKRLLAGRVPPIDVPHEPFITGPYGKGAAQVIAVATALGLALGHALDLAFPRLYTDEPLRGPLHRCPSCRTPPPSLFLLPFLGFLRHRGLCPHCSAPLPWRALLLPSGAAALFALAAIAIDEFGPALLAGLFATAFLALTFTDLERRLIPNRVVYPCLLLAAALSWAWPDRSVAQIFAGGLVGLAITLLLFVVGRGAFGFGDVKMAALMGLVVGLPNVLAGIFISAFAAGAVVAPLLLLRILHRRDYIPYGPFLALGAVVALLWGDPIWHWYSDR